MNKTDKPKLTSEELVERLESKGVSFTIVNKQEAEIFLRDRNNYMRTASYRKNYGKYNNGETPDKYINLEFAYLKELSTIDMHLRRLISKMCLDIEHALKVQMLKDVENNSDEDGYDIVKQFIDENPKILRRLEATSASPYTEDLLAKYFTIEKKENEETGKFENEITEYNDCPVWVFLELITFGDFINFYEFHCERNNKKSIKKLINMTKSLRNACAHNNCILANLKKNVANPNGSVNI